MKTWQNTGERTVEKMYEIEEGIQWKLLLFPLENDSTRCHKFIYVLVVLNIFSFIFDLINFALSMIKFVSLKIFN